MLEYKKLINGSEQRIFMKKKRWMDYVTIKPGRHNKNQVKLLNFLMRMIIFAIPLYVFLIFDIRLFFIQDFVRNTSFFLLSAAGMNPVLQGYVISIPIQEGSWGAMINWDCTGWKSVLFMFALLMATDKRSKAKALGLVLFLPLVFIVNIIRIFFMFWFVRTFDLSLFPIVHAAVWSWGLIIAVLFFWVIWMKVTNTKSNI